MKKMSLVDLAACLLVLGGPFVAISLVWSSEDCDGTWSSTAEECMPASPCDDIIQGANCGDQVGEYNPRQYSFERYSGSGNTRSNEYNDQDCLEQWHCMSNPDPNIAHCLKGNRVEDIDHNPVFTQVGTVYADVSCVVD